MCFMHCKEAKLCFVKFPVVTEHTTAETLSALILLHCLFYKLERELEKSLPIFSGATELNRQDRFFIFYQQSRLCATLNLPHVNRLCIDTKPAFSFWINVSTVSEVRCDCQGLGLVARIEASILVFDTMQVFCIYLFWDKSSFVASIEDAKPVLIQNRFCTKTGFVA